MCAGVSGSVGGVGVVVRGGGLRAVSGLLELCGGGLGGDGGALPGWCCRLAGGGPLAGFGVGEEQHLRLARGAADDDLGAAWVLGALWGGVDLGGEHAPGVHAVAGQDADGELFADLRATEGAGGRGLGNEQDVHADLAAMKRISMSASIAGEVFGSPDSRILSQ
ncbi:hypothetical protein [Streptomyces sp. 11-1-2]|uniref:hypothetical protein n=1 Tax=Streptomyces sp. 11-1-2 TaxID=1851167 RepID=UPI0013C4BE14|nr:hypothetical protein [Streptomyces sp. 11-1-2]